LRRTAAHRQSERGGLIIKLKSFISNPFMEDAFCKKAKGQKKQSGLARFTGRSNCLLFRFQNCEGQLRIADP